MTLEQYAYLAEVLGVIAILVTLIFLTFQLMQNNSLLRSESRKALLSNDQTSLLVALDHVDIFEKMTSPEELSHEDQLRLSWVYAIDMRNREFEYFQYREGVLDEAAWQSYREIILMNHATDRGRRWWETVGRTIFDSDFAESVDELLRDAPIDDRYEKLASWDTK